MPSRSRARALAAVIIANGGGIKPPHWFAVDRLTDNRIKGLMREIAEIIDSETEAAKLSALRTSLTTLAAGAHDKAHRASKGRHR